MNDSSCGVFRASTGGQAALKPVVERNLGDHLGAKRSTDALLRRKVL